MAQKNLITWVNNLSSNWDSGSTGDFWVGDFYPTITDPLLPTTIWKEIDSTFNKLWAGRTIPFIADDSKLPKTNIYDKNGKLIIECAIPFAKREDVKVSLDPLTNGVKIEVQSHQNTEKESDNITHYLNEISRTSFKRSFAIDKRYDIKKANATFEDGVLKIEIPTADHAEEIVLKL